MDKAEATADVQQRQDENTAALVMNTFYKVASEGSATVEDITKYLLDKFGDVWQVMKIHFPNLGIYSDAAEGLLEQQGDRFIAALARETGCCRRRRRRRRRSCGRVRKRRRRSCRRRHRKKKCCCKNFLCSCGGVCKQKPRSCRRKRKKSCCSKK
ncbi:hypothetical protein ABMA28_000544 [Loxostege sticticalis]|uniref:Uncharacterized protein n=1 Tax=Loxostege sticticalis TaxID=481309 RepID=A0ABD0TSK6_LOXSC